MTFPEFERDYEFVALRHGEEYPFNEGRVVSNKGLDIDVRDYEQHFVEKQAPHSHALHSTLKARGDYFAGPLARYNLNFDRLTPLARETAREAGLGPVCLNPFQSIIVRAVETALRRGGGLGHHRGLREAGEAGGAGGTPGGGGLRRHRSPPGVALPPLPAGREGVILEAKIVPPTSQNQGTIEADLGQFVSQRLDLPDEQLTWQCEQMVRNYDPCISCATHFLKVNLERLLASDRPPGRPIEEGGHAGPPLRLIFLIATGETDLNRSNA